MAIVKMDIDTTLSEDIKPDIDLLTIEEHSLHYDTTEGPEIKNQQLKSGAKTAKPDLPLNLGEFSLGSVTVATNNTECSEVKNQQLRSSARVVKTNVEQLTTDEHLLGSVTINNAEGSETKSQQLRSSARVFKKMKLDLTTPPVVMEKPEKKEEIKQDIKRCYRPLWSSEDKTAFFEALNEFGKNFENIQLYISMKQKKKGIPENLIKNKEQVRHLYYRTWHKISKYIKFSDGVIKLAQELYSLINYGELRKKVGSVSQKCLLKLNELIYTGSTMLRLKGKTVRVKTPMCRALRRLNQLDEKYDEIRLPNRVTVELRPKDMTSFLRVQCMAQNPRIRTTLPLQKRLSNLINCINKRWKTVDAQIYDKALISSNPITDCCVPPANICDENKLLLAPYLRLTPPADCKINIISINLSEYFTRKSICLHSYENRIGIMNTDYSFYDTNIKLTIKNSSKKGSRARTDSISDKSEKSPQKVVPKIEDVEIGDIMESEQNSEINNIVSESINTLIEPPTLQHVENQENDGEALKIKIEKKEVPNDFVYDQNQSMIEKIRMGWTEQDSESITLGELYLMFGADLKLTLEYSWEKPINFTENECIAEDMELNADLSNDSSRKLDLSDSLSKLLSVAKLHYRKNIIKCPCGHVCGTKNNAQLKRAMESKIRKMLKDIDKCTDEPDDKITPEENIFENEQPFVPTPMYMQPNLQLSPATYFHPPNTQMIHLVSQINNIQRLQPRYCNRRGRRPRSKQVVVERKLPLLPNKMESGHQIVRMNIISQESTSTNQVNFDMKNMKSEVKGESSNIFLNQDQHLSNPVFTEQSQLTSDIISKNLNSNDVLELANDNTILPSAPSSPSRILKEDNQWINSEVADYSLSSLLGHLESPMKAASSITNLSNDDSRLSQDVDAQINSLLTESSLDFSANFADLAAQVANESRK